VTDETTTIVDSRLQRAFILISLTFSSALPTLNVTVGNAVLPQMRGDLSAGLEEISWVLTATMVCTAIAMPTAGWFGMRFSQRRALIVCIVAFTLASAMLGFADTLGEVVFWRACQGLFGGPISPLCIPVILSTYPKRDHGMAMALWAGGVMLSPIMGPPLGGYLTALYDWHLTFVFMVPLGILTYFLVVWAIPDSQKRADLRFDWMGFLALSTAVAATQIMLDRGTRLDWFESGEITIWALVAAGAFYVFLIHSLTTRQPFMDLRIFQDKNFSIGCTCLLVSGVLTFAPLMLLPTLLGDLRSVPVETIGLMLMPRGLGFVLGTFVLGRLIKVIDSRVMLALGFLIEAAAFWYMTTFDLTIGLFEVFIAGVVLGTGEAVMWTPVAAITFSTLAPHRHAYGSAIFQFGRFFASGMGISAAVIVLSRSTQSNHATLSEFISPFNETIRTQKYAAFWDISSVEGLARLDAELTRQAAMIGYINDFWLLMVLTLAVMPLILFLDRPGNSE
jgi:DHA2 family multidrug resistance protein